MGYSSLRACIDDLEENKLLIRIKEEMDPNLEMASRHLQEFKNSGKALLFENIKGSKYSAVSNLFGTLERSNFIFRNSIHKVKKIIDLKLNPIHGFKNPMSALSLFGKFHLWLRREFFALKSNYRYEGEKFRRRIIRASYIN